MLYMIWLSNRIFPKLCKLDVATQVDGVCLHGRVFCNAPNLLAHSNFGYIPKQ